MTNEEREKILDVICTADSGCPSCIRSLLEKLRAVLPDEPWPIEIPSDEQAEREKRTLKAFFGEDA